MLTSPSYAAARWKALGTYVGLVVADAERLEAAQVACSQVLDAVDQSCSRFRPDSDLSRANQAAGRWVRVAPLLLRAVTEAVEAAAATDGLVDPTLGASLVALGYDRDLAEVRTNDPDDSLGAAGTLGTNNPVGTVAPGFVTGSLPTGIPAVADAWRRIEIDPDGALRVPAGVALDLGATGKAFAADLIAATVPDQVGTSLIISLGGDVAIGTRTGQSGPAAPERFAHPWRVDVAERPEDAEAGRAETVVLTEGGLATSSTMARRWRRDGHWVHHLLDPSTGLPVRPIWRTVSVCAASCLEANAASTAAIVLAERAPDWLAERDLAARLVSADGGVVRVAGWPEVEE